MSDSASIPVGVVGAGHMGRLHARTWAQLPGARLVGITDVLDERAQAVAAEVGSRAFPDILSLGREIQAASVAVSTHAHRQVAEELLALGVDVLVEKPLAATAADARQIVAAAASAKAILMVGHTERFNPAVRAVEQVVRAPGFVEVHRLAQFTPRGTDVDVILDLMIHDLDLLAHFVSAEVTSVDADGVPVLTDGCDIASARLRFASGTVANLTASRVSFERMRKIRFFERDLYVSLDTASRSAKGYRLVRSGGSPRIEPLDLAQGPGEDPVVAELAAFLAAVRSRSEPPVPGAHGLRALELAERVLASIQANGARR